MSSPRPATPAGERPKRRLRAAQRREVIEQAAASVFAARGYHGSTIDEIAARPRSRPHWPEEMNLTRCNQRPTPFSGAPRTPSSGLPTTPWRRRPAASGVFGRARPARSPRSSGHGPRSATTSRLRHRSASRDRATGTQTRTRSVRASLGRFACHNLHGLTTRLWDAASHGPPRHCSDAMSGRPRLLGERAPQPLPSRVAAVAASSASVRGR